jgi:hypothetical protein
MYEYLAGMKRPLPHVVTDAVKMAREYGAGSVGIDRVRHADEQVSRFLKESNDVNEHDKGFISVARASGALLKLFEVPTWGGGASEALSNFLEWVDEFEQNHPLFEQLLEEFFGKPDR